MGLGRRRRAQSSATTPKAASEGRVPVRAPYRPVLGGSDRTHDLSGDLHAPRPRRCVDGDGVRLSTRLIRFPGRFFATIRGSSRGGLYDLASALVRHGLRLGPPTCAGAVHVWRAGRGLYAQRGSANPSVRRRSHRARYAQFTSDWLAGPERPSPHAPRGEES